MSCHVAYPTEFPLDCLRAIIKAVRTKTVMDDLPSFLAHSWTVVGYALGQIAGGRLLVHKHGKIAGKAISDLFAVTDRHRKPAVGAIPWALIISIILKLIEQYLKKA